MKYAHNLAICASKNYEGIEQVQYFDNGDYKIVNWCMNLQNEDCVVLMEMVFDYVRNFICFFIYVR